ncbi:DUF5681 domain-containing protein [Bradyrhizobium erythrophlei]|uniref:DUF5681 domain-containing protein n=1 Tax=Bradyrhizobium erythrophlei TaxID=1437360 RepID=A0A1M7UXW9_9BRAD|nr:DUF5681 domain-containing protein [Bradyrhizobium erythrophlei]SHN87804.1 hypothetical protein SAMN05444170_7376 [Bradyrhizobium erythrophlei]
MTKKVKFHHIEDDAENPGDEDKVGYRKPPKHSRFRRGQSGNPRGRPRVAYEKDDFPVRRFMMEPVEVTRKGKKEQVTTYEAILMRLAAKALAGDSASAKLLLKHTGGLKDFREEWKRVMTEADMKMIEMVREASNAWVNDLADKKAGKKDDEES